MKKRMVNLAGEYLAAGLYDVTGNEKWLADKARDGWLADEVNSNGRVEFVDSTPNETVRYRLRPARKREKRPSEEEIELNEAFGWRYLGTAKKCLHLWRCDDPAAPELDTDPEVQAESFRCLVRSSIQSCVMQLVGESILLLICLGLISSGSLVDLVWRGRMGMLLMMAAYVLLASVGLILETVVLVRRVRLLRTGISARGRMSYQFKRRFGYLLSALYVLILALYFIPGDFQPTMAKDAIYPSICALEGTANGGEDTMYSIKTKRMELAPKVWLIRQYGRDDSQLETEYYRMLTEGLAQRMETDLVEKCEWEKSNEAEMIRLESEELDSFWWMRCPDGTQYAVARLGSCVMKVHYYNGESDLRENTGLFTETLKTK